MKKLYLHLWMVVVMFFPPAGVAGDVTPDYEREQRISEQIEPDIFDGEAVWLSDGEREFLSIHIAVDGAKGAVILMHGRDVSPEEQELIGPLRVGLAESGWTTLALQMPVLEKGKKYYDYLPILPLAHPRIEAAINFLREQGESKIVLAAHSCGAHMTNSWLNTNPGVAIDGYIAMGLGATDAGQDLRTPFPIDRISVPVLDIYGSEEFPRPLSMVDERKQMLARNGNPLSAQVAVEGANHYFTGYGDRMVEELSVWLDTLADQ